MIQSMLDYGGLQSVGRAGDYEFTRRGDVYCGRCGAYRQCVCAVQAWHCLTCGRAGFMLHPLDSAIEIFSEDRVIAPHDCGSEDDGIIGYLQGGEVG